MAPLFVNEIGVKQAHRQTCVKNYKTLLCLGSVRICLSLTTFLVYWQRYWKYNVGLMTIGVNFLMIILHFSL
jgi:hypothetical protein